MAPSSPAEALGSHTDTVREVVVEVVRTRHEYSAEAHQAGRTRYNNAFGTQWRDLLVDVDEAHTSRGFRSHTLVPGGYKLPVVNDCLVYVWRVPNGPEAVKNFASSPTRLSGFVAPPPPAMLWEGEAPEKDEPRPDSREHLAMMEALRDSMPLVLVMVWSTPRQLQSIEWAVARLDNEGRVALHGQESLWKSELVGDDVTSDVESFDSGAPVVPVVALQHQDQTPDA